MWWWCEGCCVYWPPVLVDDDDLVVPNRICWASNKARKRVSSREERAAAFAVIKAVFITIPPLLLWQRVRGGCSSNRDPGRGRREVGGWVGLMVVYRLWNRNEFRRCEDCVYVRHREESSDKGDWITRFWGEIWTFIFILNIFAGMTNKSLEWSGLIGFENLQRDLRPHFCQFWIVDLGRLKS